MDYMVPHVELMSINKLAQPKTAGCRTTRSNANLPLITRTQRIRDDLMCSWKMQCIGFVFHRCLSHIHTDTHTHTQRHVSLASTLSKGTVYFNHNEAIDTESRRLK